MPTTSVPFRPSERCHRRRWRERAAIAIAIATPRTRQCAYRKLTQRFARAQSRTGRRAPMPPIDRLRGPGAVDEGVMSEANPLTWQVRAYLIRRAADRAVAPSSRGDSNVEALESIVRAFCFLFARRGDGACARRGADPGRWQADPHRHPHRATGAGRPRHD